MNDIESDVVDELQQPDIEAESEKVKIATISQLVEKNDAVILINSTSNPSYQPKILAEIHELQDTIRSKNSSKSPPNQVNLIPFTQVF